MTSDHQNRKKEPYHFFQDDYIIIFSTQTLKSVKRGTNLWRTERGQKSYLFVDLRLEKVY